MKKFFVIYENPGCDAFLMLAKQSILRTLSSHRKSYCLIENGMSIPPASPSKSGENILICVEELKSFISRLLIGTARGCMRGADPIKCLIFLGERNTRIFACRVLAVRALIGIYNLCSARDTICFFTYGAAPFSDHKNIHDKMKLIQRMVRSLCRSRHVKFHPAASLDSDQGAA